MVAAQGRRSTAALVVVPVTATSPVVLEALARGLLVNYMARIRTTFKARAVALVVLAVVLLRVESQLPQGLVPLSPALFLAHRQARPAMAVAAAVEHRCSQASVLLVAVETHLPQQRQTPVCSVVVGVVVLATTLGARVVMALFSCAGSRHGNWPSRCRHSGLSER